MKDEEYLNLSQKVQGICPFCKRYFAAKKDPSQLKEVLTLSAIHDGQTFTKVHPLIYSKCPCQEKAKEKAKKSQLSYQRLEGWDSLKTLIKKVGSTPS